LGWAKFEGFIGACESSQVMGAMSEVGYKDAEDANSAEEGAYF
jgi:hypothetical protein